MCPGAIRISRSDLHRTNERRTIMHACMRWRGRNNDGWLVDDLKFQNTDRILHRHPAFPSLEKVLDLAVHVHAIDYPIRDTPPPHNIPSIITEVQGRRGEAQGIHAIVRSREIPIP
jgi:hypothetical protein